MIGFDYERLSKHRIQDLRRETAGIVAARQGGAPSSAKRIARLLRNVAERIDGEASPLNSQPLPSGQFRVNRLRTYAR